MEQVNHFKNIDTIIERLGGEEIVRTIVERFYDFMESLPEAQSIRRLHPADLGSSRKKTYLYLLGRFGGEDTYVKKYGHPRLRQRHSMFPIGPEERRLWLMCMQKAVDEVVPDEKIRQELMDFFSHVSAFIQNRKEMEVKIKK